MACLKCLALLMLLLLATCFSDKDRQCVDGATCSADAVELQQEIGPGTGPRSRSLVQMQAIKMRYPAEDVLQLGVAESPASEAPAAGSNSLNSGMPQLQAVNSGLDSGRPVASSEAPVAKSRLPVAPAAVLKGSVDTAVGATATKFVSSSPNTKETDAIVAPVSGRLVEPGTLPKSEASAPVAEAAAPASIPTTTAPMDRELKNPTGQALSVEPSRRQEERSKEESEESSTGDTNPQRRHGFMHDLTGGLFDIENASAFIRGKPQILSIFIMMLLPAGMCTVMYCVFHIIRMMEDDSPSGDRDSNAASSSRRATLGEVMQPQDASQRSYEPLCPELLAPSGNECVIALPSVHDVSSGNTLVERTIVSKTGSPIVRLTLTRMSDSVADDAGGGTSYGASGQTVERLSIIGFKRQNALGFCELRIPPAHSIGIGPARQQMKCDIFRPTGDLFATLEEEPTGVVGSLLATHGSAGVSTGYGSKCYMLTTVATGARFWIQGDLTKRNVVVLSEDKKKLIYVDSGEQLQFKFEENDYYRIRVQPKVDAGVVILALLAMDRLAGSQRAVVM